MNMATPALGPSLGTAPCGNVDVDVALGEEFGIDAEALGAGADQAIGGRRGFFHDVADLAGQRDLTLAGHAGGFDEEDFAADGGVGHAGGDAGDAGSAGQFRIEFSGAQDLGHAVFGDGESIGFAFDDLGGDRAGDRSDLPFQVSHAGFAGVALDDPAQGRILELYFFRRYAVGVQLAGHEIRAGDVQLVAVGVAGDFDHFHAVAQRPGHRVHGVGGGDEEHAGKIERDIKIMIGERVILGRVEDFEQRSRGIAAEIRAELCRSHRAS